MTDKDYAEILKGLAVPIHAEPAMDRAIDLLEQEPMNISELVQKAYEDGKKDGYVRAKIEQQPCEEREQGKCPFYAS